MGSDPLRLAPFLPAGSQAVSAHDSEPVDTWDPLVSAQLVPFLPAGSQAVSAHESEPFDTWDTIDPLVSASVFTRRLSVHKGSSPFRRVSYLSS